MDYNEQIAFLRRHEGKNSVTRRIHILQRLQRQENAMDKEKIMDYARRIKPVMRGNSKHVLLAPEVSEKDLYWIPSVPIHTQSCAFSSDKPLQRAYDLIPAAMITTYHRHGGYYGCLRPSADEAIYQCPKLILDQVCAFEFTVQTLDFSKVYDAKLDRHVLMTIYYTGKLPQIVADQEVTW